MPCIAFLVFISLPTHALCLRSDINILPTQVELLVMYTSSICNKTCRLISSIDNYLNYFTVT
jgi:hypothetical protein